MYSACTQSCTGGLTTIMPMGDSITYGCGSNATAPAYTLECSTGDGSYRARLYQLLRAAGKRFRFVGSMASGSEALPPSQRHHEGQCVHKQLVSTTTKFPGTSLIACLCFQQRNQDRPDGRQCAMGELAWRGTHTTGTANAGHQRYLAPECECPCDAAAAMLASVAHLCHDASRACVPSLGPSDGWQQQREQLPASQPCL